jgi:predicted lipoprotein with Yx(FWY)xxD motif
MVKRLPVLLASTGLLLALSISAACGGSSNSTTTPSPTRTITSTATVLTASNATLGKTILVNSAGLTLYTSANDTSGTSNCTGTCASLWPPLPVGTGTPTGGPGVTGTLATITRSDGTRQVTYNGKPLYTLEIDGSAGRASGDGVNSFHVATP